MSLPHVAADLPRFHWETLHGERRVGQGSGAYEGGQEVDDWLQLGPEVGGDHDKSAGCLDAGRGVDIGGECGA